MKLLHADLVKTIGDIDGIKISLTNKQLLVTIYTTDHEFEITLYPSTSSLETYITREEIRTNQKY